MPSSDHGARKGQSAEPKALFRGSATAGAAIAASSAMTARAVPAQGATGIIDMTCTLTHDFPTYLGEWAML